MGSASDQGDKNQSFDDHIANDRRPGVVRPECDEASTGDHAENQRGEPEKVKALSVWSVQGTDRVEPSERGVQRADSWSSGRRLSVLQDGKDKNSGEGNKGEEDTEHGEEDGQLRVANKELPESKDPYGDEPNQALKQGISFDHKASSNCTHHSQSIARAELPPVLPEPDRPRPLVTPATPPVKDGDNREQ